MDLDKLLDGLPIGARIKFGGQVFNTVSDWRASIAAIKPVSGHSKSRGPKKLSADIKAAIEAQHSPKLALKAQEKIKLDLAQKYGVTPNRITSIWNKLEDKLLKEQQQK